MRLPRGELWFSIPYHPADNCEEQDHEYCPRFPKQKGVGLDQTFNL